MPLNFENDLVFGRHFSLPQFLSNSNRYFRAGFWYWEPYESVIHLGKKFIEKLGIKGNTEEIAIDLFFGYIHENDRANALKIFNRLKAKPASHKELEFRLRVKNDWQWARIVIANFEHPEGKGKRVVIGRFKPVDPVKYSRQGATTSDISSGTGFASFRYNITDGVFSWQTPLHVFGIAFGTDHFWGIDDFGKLFRSSVLANFKKNWNRFLANPDENGFAFEAETDDANYRVDAIRIPDSPFIQGAIIKKSKSEYYSISALDKFSKLLNRNQLALIEFDGRGNLIDMNRVFEKMLQSKASNPAGFDIQEYFSTDDYRKLQEWLKTESSKPLELQLKLPDGSKRFVIWTKLAIEKSNSSNVIVAVRDNTYFVELQNHLKELLASKKAYFSLLTRLHRNSSAEEFLVFLGELLEELMPKSVTVVFSYDNSDGFITLESVFGVKQKDWEAFVDDLGWNPIGRRVFIESEKLQNLMQDKVLSFSQPFNELLDGIISATAYRFIERAFKISNTFLTGIAKNGNLYGGILVFQTTESDSVNPELLAEVASISATVIEFIRYLEEITYQIDTLKELLEGKNELIAYINHSVRTPLNSILGFSSLLQVPNVDRVQRDDFVRLIHEQSQLLLENLNELQDFIKLENSSITFISSKINVNEFFVEFIDSAKTRCNQLFKESIEIESDIPPNTDFLELNIDSGRLLQALMIYVIQLARFIHSGKIHIAYSIEFDRLIIKIQEKGSNVDSRLREALADELKSLLNGHKKFSSQIGIQLANRIVMLLGGNVLITAEDRLSISVTLNLISQPDATTTSIQTLHDESQRSDFKNKLILVVDDEEVNYMILNELLVSWGASTLWAKNGREAVNLISTLNHRVNLILMDIRMPVMDGYAATMEIKQINPSIPVVAQTAFAAPEERLKAQAAGCNGYLTKPIEVDVLHHVLEVFLG